MDEDEEQVLDDDDTDIRSATTRTTAKTLKSVRTTGTFASIFGDDRGTGSSASEDCCTAFSKDKCPIDSNSGHTAHSPPRVAA